ncbi:MAG: hypothetical protein M1836_004074 [Candelina mexicana]|nr:MAG: hypothetical protein M1836_004074 [Candelina mexicana]
MLKAQPSKEPHIIIKPSCATEAYVVNSSRFKAFCGARYLAITKTFIPRPTITTEESLSQTLGAAHREAPMTDRIRRLLEGFLLDTSLTQLKRGSSAKILALLWALNIIEDAIVGVQSQLKAPERSEE